MKHDLETNWLNFFLCVVQKSVISSERSSSIMYHLIYQLQYHHRLIQYSAIQTFLSVLILIRAIVYHQYFIIVQCVMSA